MMATPDDLWFDMTEDASEKLGSSDDESDVDWDALTQSEKELAAIYWLELEVNNGGFLQYFGNLAEPYFKYARQGLERMQATAMLDHVNEAHALVAHLDIDSMRYDDLRDAFSDDALECIMKLSDEFMDYPDDLATLGVKCYGRK